MRPSLDRKSFGRNYLFPDRIKCVIGLNHLVIDPNNVAKDVIAAVSHTDCDSAGRCSRPRTDNSQLDVGAIC